MQDLGKLLGFTALMQIPFRDDPDALAYLEEIRLALKELEALKAEPQEVEPTNLEAAPTIDAKPVVHGRWIENEGCSGDSYYTCSACGCDWVVAYGTPKQNHMQYCPNCGALMDKEAKE